VTEEAGKKQKKMKRTSKKVGEEVGGHPLYRDLCLLSRHLLLLLLLTPP